MSEEASTHLGPQIDIVVDADMSNAENATKTLDSVNASIGHLATTASKLGEAVAKLEPVLVSTSQQLDKLNGKGLDYDTVTRSGRMPLLSGADFISKDIAKVGQDIVGELRGMLETIVTEVGISKDSVKQLIAPLIAEKRAVRKASNTSITFNTEMGIDAIEGLQINTQKEFQRREQLSITETEAQYNDFSNLVHDIQTRQETLKEIRKVKDAQLKEQYEAYITVLDAQIAKVSAKHYLNPDEIEALVVQSEDISEDTISTLIEHSLGSKSRPVVDLSSAPLLDNSNPIIREANAGALRNYEAYKKGLAKLRPLEKDFRTLLSNKSDPKLLTSVLDRFMEAYNSIAVAYNGLEESLQVLAKENILGTQEQANRVLRDLKDSADVILGSLHLSLTDFKEAALPTLQPKPQPITLNRQQATQYVKANPKIYADTREQSKAAMGIAKELKRIYTDIETTANSAILSIHAMSGDANVVFTHDELDGQFEDFHLENIAQEALNYRPDRKYTGGNTTDYIASRGAKRIHSKTRAEALVKYLQFVEKRPGLDVATMGDTDLEIIAQNLLHDAKDALEGKSALEDAAGRVRLVQQTRLVDINKGIRNFFETIFPGLYASTIKNKGLGALRPLIQDIIPNVMDLVPHINIDDDIMTAGWDKLLSQPNAIFTTLVDPATANGAVENRRLNQKFVDYVNTFMESPLVKYVTLLDKHRKLPKDAILDKANLEQQLRSIELTSADARTLSPEDESKLLETAGRMTAILNTKRIQDFSPAESITVTPLEQARRSNQALEELLTSIANTMAVPLRRGGSLTTAKNAVNKTQLDELFLRLIPKDNVYTGQEAENFLNSIITELSKSGAIKLGLEETSRVEGDLVELTGSVEAAAGYKAPKVKDHLHGVLKNAMYDFIIKHTGSTDFSGYSLSDSAYINNLNARLANRNFTPNIDLTRVIPAAFSERGNLLSNTELHGAEVDSFLDWLKDKPKTHNTKQGLLEAFRAHKEANPELFPADLALGGEGTELVQNALLANLPGTRVIGGKTALVGGSKDLEGGFGTAFHGLNEAGETVFTIVARFDSALVDASKGLEEFIAVLPIDVKQRRYAKSAQEVVTDPKLATQMTMYAAATGLPVGVAVSTNSNVLEVAIFKTQTDVERAVLDILQTIGKALDQNVVKVTKEQFGDFEGTLQIALNSLVSDSKSAVSLAAKDILAANIQQGLGGSVQVAHTADAKVLAENIANQVYSKGPADQAVFSEQSAARLVASAITHPEMVQRLPINTSEIDKVSFDAVNTITNKLRNNLPNLTTSDVTTGIFGSLGQTITAGTNLALSKPEFIKNLTALIDSWTNSAAENPSKALELLTKNSGSMHNIVPEKLITDAVNGINGYYAKVANSQTIEDTRSTKPTSISSRPQIEDAELSISSSSESKRREDIPPVLIGNGSGNGTVPPGSDTGGNKPVPPSKNDILSAFPDAAKEYRHDAGVVGINEELYGKSFDSTKAKALAASKEIERLTSLLASTVNTVFLDDAQKDFLSFDIKVREITLGLDAFKRAQSQVTKGESLLKSLDTSIASLKTEYTHLDNLVKDKRPLTESQTARYTSIPNILDYAENQRANVFEKVRISKAEADMWKNSLGPKDNTDPATYFANVPRKLESLADRAAAKERIDLYQNHAATLLESIGPVKVNASELLTQDSRRTEGLVPASNVDQLLAQKAYIAGLKTEFAELETNVRKNGSTTSQAFIDSNIKVKQQIELIKQLELDKASLESKRARQLVTATNPDLTDTQRRIATVAKGRLDQALELNASETENALKTIKQLLADIDTEAVKVKTNLAAAMRQDYKESVTKRKTDIQDELSLLSEKSKAGLGTPDDALKKAKLLYENAVLNRSNVSDSFAAVLDRENKNRYNLHSRAQGVEQADIFESLQSQYGMKNNGLFQSLTSDYSRLLSSPRLGASAIGTSTDKVEQKLKELKRIEEEIAIGKANGEQTIVVNLKVNWNKAKKDLEDELNALKGLIEQKFQDSLDPTKLLAKYKTEQTDKLKTLEDRKKELIAKGVAGTQTLADQKELAKIESNLISESDSGKGYTKSLLAQLQPVTNPLEHLATNARLKDLGFGTLADQTSVTDVYRKLMATTANSVAKGGKELPQTSLEKLFTEITQATSNRDFLDKQLEAYKGKDLTKLNDAEGSNYASLMSQRAAEQAKAEKLQKQLPMAIATAETDAMQPAAILQKHAEVNAALREGLLLKKQWIEAEVKAGFNIDENLQKIREINKQLTSLQDVPLSKHAQYQVDRQNKINDLTGTRTSLEDYITSGVFTLDKYKKLQQTQADLSRASGYSDSVSRLYDMQPKVESPLKAFNGNQNLANLGFGSFADMKNPIDVFKQLGSQLAKSTAESGPAYNTNVNDIMTKIAESNARKSHAEGIAKPFEKMTFDQQSGLSSEEATHLANARKTIADEIATATKLIGDLHTAINDAQTHELSDPQMLKRYAEAITLLKEGLATEKLWLEAEVKLGIASGEHVKRLQEVNLQQARLSGNVSDIKRYSEAEVATTHNPLAASRAATFAATRAASSQLQEVGIHFDTTKSDVAKQALEGLVSEFSKLDLISNSAKGTSLEKAFIALQKNYDLAKLYDTELVKINATLALDPGNSQAKQDKSIYLTLLSEQVKLQDKLVADAKDELKIQQELDRRPQVLATKAVDKAKSTLDTNMQSEGKIRAEIGAGIDLEGNIKKLHALELENNKLREAAKQGGFKSSGSAEELAKLHNVQLEGGRRGAAGFVEQIANMGTWWAEWTLGQNVMQAIPNALQGGIGFAKEFEAQMKNVELITQANKVQFEQLVNTIGQLSASRIFSPKDLAEGLIILGQAGFNAAESMKLLPAITDLATATLSSLKVAADITTTAIEAFNVPIEKSGDLANTLAAITIESKLEINSLGTTFNYIAESAAGAGLSIEQVGTAMGIMSNAGVRASTIGTSLRSVLGTLMAPNDKFKTELGKIGMSVEDVNPRYRELGTILSELKDKGFDVQAAFQGLDKRIAGAITSLISNAGEYQGFIGKISGTDRATTMAEGQMDTFDAQSKRLSHGLQLLGGEAFGPSLLPMKVATQTLAELVELMNKGLTLIPSNVRAIVGLGTAMGLASAAVMTLVSGFKLLLATSAINPATGVAYTTLQTLKALVTDKDVFKSGIGGAAGGALAGTTGVKKQFLELIAMFISPQAILLALGAATAAAIAYVGVQKLSGLSEVADTKHVADVAETFSTELNSLDKTLSKVNETTVVYAESMRKLRNEFGLMSKEELSRVATNAKLVATDTRAEALAASGSQKVNSWSDFFTIKEDSRKLASKTAKDDWIGYLKSKHMYYSASDEDVRTTVQKLNKDKTGLGNEAEYQLYLQMQEDRSKPEYATNKLAELRAATLEQRDRTDRLAEVDKLDTRYNRMYERIALGEAPDKTKREQLEKLRLERNQEIGATSSEVDKYLKEGLGARSNGSYTDYLLSGMKYSGINPLNWWGMMKGEFHAPTIQETPAELLAQYEEIKQGKRKALDWAPLNTTFSAMGYNLTDKDVARISELKDREKASLEAQKAEEALAGSKYLKAKGEQTGFTYSGAQLAIIEELKTTKTKWEDLKGKVASETNEGLKAIYEEDLRSAESTMKRLAKSASVLLIEKLPGFENAKNIPKGILQTLDQFVPYINAGTTASSSAEEVANIQSFNTKQLSGVNPVDLPDVGKKLAAVKDKWEKVLSESGLAKFDPQKAGEQWSKNHEVYFAIQARMDLEMQETVESVITAGWARIEPKLAKVKTTLQEMAKLKQFNIELGFSTSMNEINMQAMQATLDYLSKFQPKGYAVLNKGGMDETSQTGRFVNDTTGFSIGMPRKDLYTSTADGIKLSALGVQNGLQFVDSTKTNDLGKAKYFPGPNDNFIAAETKTKRVSESPDYYTYRNPDDISYNWRSAGSFKPYFQRGGVDQIQEFRISQDKEFATIQAELKKGESLALEKMRTAVLTYGFELGTYTKTGKSTAPKDTISSLEDLFGQVKKAPQTGTQITRLPDGTYTNIPQGARPIDVYKTGTDVYSDKYIPGGPVTQKPTTIEGYMEAVKTAASPMDILTNIKGMEEQVLLDQSKAKADVAKAQAALDAAKQAEAKRQEDTQQYTDLTTTFKPEVTAKYMEPKPAAVGTGPRIGNLTPTVENAELLNKAPNAPVAQGIDVASLAAENIKKLEANLAEAQSKELTLNTVTAEKIVASKKTAYTAIAEAQKESLNNTYAMLQKELAMHVATAKKIEENNAYRAQVKSEAQTVMEGFAKATGDWKEPSGSEKVSRVQGLRSDMESAFAAGNVEEAKRAYAKLKDTAVKYRDDGTMGTEDKRRLGDAFASASSIMDDNMVGVNRKLKQEDEDRGSKWKEIVKKKLEEDKSILDVTQDQVSKMNSTDLAKHTQNLEKYKALESIASKTPEEIGKMGSDERMKTVFDKERLDIEGFNKSAEKFAAAVDLLLKRAGETGGLTPDKPGPDGSKQPEQPNVKLDVRVVPTTEFDKYFLVTAEQVVDTKLQKEFGGLTSK